MEAMQEPEFTVEQQMAIAQLDPNLVAKARKLHVHYWEFRTTPELDEGIARFLKSNPSAAELLNDTKE